MVKIAAHKTMNPVRSFKKFVLRTEIVLGLAFTRALIRYVPFRWWRARIGPMGKEGGQAAAPLSPKQQKQARDIGRIVTRLARKVPFEAVCLPQAMTARWVMGRRGIPSRIEFGSRQDATPEGLAMHAWLMAGDEAVTGRNELESYKSFSAHEARSEKPG